MGLRAGPEQTAIVTLSHGESAKPTAGEAAAAGSCLGHCSAVERGSGAHRIGRSEPCIVDLDLPRLRLLPGCCSLPRRRRRRPARTPSPCNRAPARRRPTPAASSGRATTPSTTGATARATPTAWPTASGCAPRRRRSSAAGREFQALHRQRQTLPGALIQQSAREHGAGRGVGRDPAPHSMRGASRRAGPVNRRKTPSITVEQSRPTRCRDPRARRRSSPARDGRRS